jgi:putative oxidoreductase
MAIGTFALRAVVGGLFVGHGLQKLRGSFGGPGIGGTTRMMESLRLEPAKRNAVMAALSETLGGAGVAAGAGTPFAGAALIGAMTTAIRKVHLKQGLWNTGGGFEYNLVLVAAVTAIVAEGPGGLSFDALIGRSKWGPLWGLATLAAGVAGSTAVVELGHRQADAMDATASGDAGGSPAEASGSGPAGGEGIGDGAEQVTDSADVARQQGLDPAETADASI